MNRGLSREEWEVKAVLGAEKLAKDKSEHWGLEE